MVHTYIKDIALNNLHLGTVAEVSEILSGKTEGSGGGFAGKDIHD